jgi:hypothetical protein
MMATEEGAGPNSNDDKMYRMFVLLRVGPNLGTKCSQPKINFLLLKIDTLVSSPFELSSVFKKYLVVAILAVNIVRL